MVVEDEDDENHHLDEEKQDVEKDKEDGIYSPDDEDDENSFDHNDTMSEDDVLGNHQSNDIEQEALDISSGEDRSSGKSKKKQKKDEGPKECIENSLAWKHFKVLVHTKEDPGGPKALRAMCIHCARIYVYI